MSFEKKEKEKKEGNNKKEKGGEGKREKMSLATFAIPRHPDVSSVILRFYGICNHCAITIPHIHAIHIAA